MTHRALGPVNYKRGDATSGAGAAGVTVIGTSPSENTTTSTTLATLKTITLTSNVATDGGCVVTGLWRKGSGAAAHAGIGLAIGGSGSATVFSATEILTDRTMGATSNAAEDGYFSFTIWQRASSYLHGAMADIYGSTAAAGTNTPFGATATEILNEAISTITITGLVTSASITLGVSNVTVHSLAGA